MKKVAIVILNYLNYEDTIECLDSIFYNKYNLCSVIVVDNASDNESFQVLKKKYDSNKLVHILKTKKNLGFAKGNNVGIHYAKNRLKADYVLVVNNDTIFTESDYLDILMNYDGKDVGVIGSKILLKRKRVQRQLKTYTELSASLTYYVVLWLYYLKMDSFAGFIENLLLNHKKKTSVLHGCALLFTPKFFEYYKGFYSKTFLYNEESILYIMLKKVNLKQVYVDTTVIYHKEDMSSQLSFKNDNTIKQKLNLQSYKYIFEVILTPYKMLKK